jgi:hypothetical protein
MIHVLEKRLESRESEEGFIFLRKSRDIVDLLSLLRQMGIIAKRTI